MTFHSGQPDSIANVLSTGKLAGLVKQADRNSELLDRVRDLVPAALRSHVVAARVVDSALTVSVDTGAWCARLRWSAPAVRPLMSELDVTELRVRVLPPGGIRDVTANHRQ